jgi:hypothetical protein
MSGSYNLPLNQGSAAPAAIPPGAAGAGVRAQPLKRSGRGKTSTEPQQAAPSTFVWPGAPADGKIKNGRPRGDGRGRTKMDSEGMAGIKTTLDFKQPLARPGAGRTEGEGVQKA